MYIRRKVFSILEDRETGEERYFSTTDITLENEAEKLFSIIEEPEEREFARKDYEGLSEEGQKALKAKRSEIAKELAQKRNSANKVYGYRVGADEALQEKYARRRVNEYNSAINSAKNKAQKARVDIGKDLGNKTKNLPAVVNNSLPEKVAKKGLKLGKGGMITLGLTGAAALGYGAKKAYDHYKNKEK